MIETRPETGIVVKVPDLSSILIDGLGRINAAAEALNPGCRQATSLSTLGEIGYTLIESRGASAVFALCTEGVGPDHPITDEKPLTFGVYKQFDKTGEELAAFEILPCANARLGRTDLLALPVLDERPLEEFIRTFGHRLETNFHVWQRAIDKFKSLT